MLRHHKVMPALCEWASMVCQKTVDRRFMNSCPSPNPLWLQGLVTAVPVLLIGLLAWFVSRGQLLVAKEKLRHDLFERRFTVFYTFQKYLLAVAAGEDTKELGAEVVAALATARFLFDQDQFEFLRTTFMGTAQIGNMKPLLADPNAWATPLERITAMNKHANDTYALYDKIDEIGVKLASKLCLRDFGPH